MATPQHQQTGRDIQALEGLEAVRKRPGMYIGGTDVHALHHIVYEVVDNAIDEAMAGRCDFIEVVIHPDSSVTVTDNGGGIPVENHWQKGIPTLELVLTTLHAGGKFGSGAYSVSGGLHGVGVKAVNAVSAWCVAEVMRDGHLWRQTYERGIKTSEVEAIREMGEGEGTGTRITFYPDDQIFTGVRQEFDLNFKTLADRFREMAYVVRGVTISLIDERETPLPRETTFYFEGGLSAFVCYLNRNRDAIHEVVSGSGQSTFNMIIEGQTREAQMEVEFAFQYTDGTNSTELTFANTINTPDGGTHQTGLRTALTRAINNYARKSAFLKEKDANFTGRHTLDGLTAIVSVRHPNPQFESQTKVKLMNPEVNPAVAQVVSEAFNEWLENNPKEGKKIVDKCLTTMRIQDALDKQRELLLGERKSFLANTTLPGKLADCSDRGENTEIYIVEGDSAGGSAKQGRDRHFQAILPLRGKILNTERATLNKILDSDSIKMLIAALGTGIRDDFNLDKMRYGKLIIMTDADVDGSHIRTLLLTFFFRYMQPMITAGRLYIAQPPIFRLEYKKNATYVYPEGGVKEDALLQRLLKGYPEPDKVGVQRYKGLGEMNADQLWETTMNPEKRTLLQVTFDDAAAADHTFDMLMGPEVPPRKKFIMTHSKEATLDI
ncbi:MAG TPA: DNA topoisomerase subunit B [Aggregatilineales bacterium]|nr:type IIA DNA topoisomerase subunit B [Anaerolineales bacterium]HRE48649.1 DNA topoisomerase subunit B [Aggregatilineales bacterium]